MGLDAGKGFAMLSIFVIILEFLFLIMLHPLMGEDTRFLVDLLFITALSVVLICDFARSRKLRRVGAQLAVGYLWRVTLMFLDIYGKNIISLPGSGGDSEGYFRHAVIYITTGKVSYGGLFSRLMGILYKYTGVSRLYGQFIVVLSSVATLCILYFILEEIGIDMSARKKTIGIVAFLPNYAILSSIFLRESFIIMLCTISFWLFVKWLRRNSNLDLVGAFAFVFAASAFHSGVAGVAVGYIAVLFLYNREKKNFHSKWTNIVPAALLVAVMAFLYINYADTLFGKMGHIDSIEDISSGVGRGSSSYAKYVGNSKTPLNMVIFTLPRIIYYLFSPFPWQWRGLSDIIAFVFSSCFYLLVVWRVIKYLRQRKNDENRYVVLALSIVALCVVFIFSWGVSNTGTAIRHRDKVIALFAALYALTYDVGRGLRLTW